MLSISEAAEAAGARGCPPDSPIWTCPPDSPLILYLSDALDLRGRGGGGGLGVSPRFPLILYLPDTLDLHRHAIGQLLQADRRARVRPVLAPQLAEEIRRAVNDCRRPREVLSAVHHAE